MNAMTLARLVSGAVLSALVLLANGPSARADVLDDIIQPTGSDVETAKLLAKDLGVEFELVPTTGATRIPSLQTGKADVVISTLSVTAERATVIDFSPAYAPLRTVLAGMKSINVKTIADLDGKTV